MRSADSNALDLVALTVNDFIKCNRLSYIEVYQIVVIGEESVIETRRRRKGKDDWCENRRLL